MIRSKILVLLTAVLSLTVLAGLFTACDDGGSSSSGTSYTITFNPQGGTWANAPATGNRTVSVKEGNVITPPAAVTKDDLTFGGWWTTASGTTGTQLTATTKATGTATYHARWSEGGGDEEVEYTEVALGAFNVTNSDSQKGWASNGYDSNETDVEVEDFLEATYLKLVVDSKPSGGMQVVWQGAGAGVSAGGWNQADVLSGVGVPSAGTTVTEEGGKWVVKIKLADALAETNNNPPLKYTAAKVGIKFIVCYYTPDISGLAGLEAFLLVPDTTIAARTYSTVTFDTDGGTPATIDSVEICNGYALGGKLPANPTKAPLMFAGWKSGETTYTGNTLITANATLKAQWVTPVTVTFDYQGGKATNGEVKLAPGATLTSAQIPTAAQVGLDDTEQNAFGGWYLEAACNNSAATVLAAAINADVTFYARWLPPVTISFNLDGGKLGSATSITPLVIPVSTAMGDNYPVPSKPAFEFGGWFYNTTEYTKNTVVDASVTLTAKWNAPAPFVIELPVEAANQTKWEAGTDFTHLQMQVAKFLVFDVTSVSGQNGFGGLQIATQGADPLGGWQQAQFCQNWNACTNVDLDSSSEDQFYIVVDLTSTSWASKISATEGYIQFFLNTKIPTDHLVFNGAYLTNIEMEMPENDADDTTNECTSWAARTVPEIADKL